MVQAESYGSVIAAEDAVVTETRGLWRRRSKLIAMSVSLAFVASIVLIHTVSEADPTMLRQVPISGTLSIDMPDCGGNQDCSANQDKIVGAKLNKLPGSAPTARPPSPAEVAMMREVKTDSAEIHVLRDSLASVIRTENALIGKYRELLAKKTQKIPGPRGPEGPAGKGIIGAPGAPGDRGQIGPQGRPGIPGIQGAPGVAGRMGAPGRPGKPGKAGWQGATGPRGGRGPVGPPGKPGPIGVLGPRGPEGRQGSPGPPGPQGVAGVQGPVGAPGKDGAVGPQGLNGIPGPPGGTGPQGAMGPGGSIGPIGPPGQVGLPGNAGPPGPPGPVGKPTRIAVYWGLGVDLERQGRLFVNSLVRVAGAEISYFYHFDEADLSIAMRHHVIAIPPLNPTPTLKVCHNCRRGLLGYVQQGHKIIVGGGKGSLAWLDDVFGTRLIPVQVNGPSTFDESSGKTPYLDSAGSLPAVNGVMGVTVRSLGSHKPGQRLQCVYKQGKTSSVFWIKSGDGFVFYYGFNWFTGPALADISHWESALGSAFLM